MVSVKRDLKTPIFLILLVLVIGTNVTLYRLPLIDLPNSTEIAGIVLASLLDLAIVAPLLVLAITRKKGFTIKKFITLMVIGIVAARFIIPMKYFEPFIFVPYIAIAFEGIILLAEVWLVFLLLKHMPRIIEDVRRSEAGPLFSFSIAVEKRVSNNPIIKVLAAELLMFYYAFATWKKQFPKGSNSFTIHKKTSLIAVHIMLIHALIIETIGVHFWLYDKWLIVSIVLLIFNVYGVIYFVGDIQAIRHNPLFIQEKQIYVSLGLGKRMVIPFEQIEHIAWDKEAANENLKAKGIIDFIARDFEEIKPQCIITFKKSIKAKSFLGLEKAYTKAAIRVDEPERFRNCLELQLL